MSNTHRKNVPTGKDLWVKPYTKKNLSSNVFSWDGESKKLFRNKERAVLKHEFRKKVSNRDWEEDIVHEDDHWLEYWS